MSKEELYLLDKILKKCNIKAYEIPVYESLCNKLQKILIEEEPKESTENN